jgi:hypothetical protein
VIVIDRYVVGAVILYILLVIVVIVVVSVRRCRKR